MEAQEYIKNKITELTQLFPEMKFTYKYDKESEIHEIIAEPKREYDKTAFEEVEIEFYDEFADKFPFEGIVINTPDEAIIDDEYIIYEKEGSSYFDLSFTIDESLMSSISFLLKNESFKKNTKPFNFNELFDIENTRSELKNDEILIEKQDVTESDYSPLAA